MGGGSGCGWWRGERAPPSPYFRRSDFSYHDSCVEGHAVVTGWSCVRWAHGVGGRAETGGAARLLPTPASRAQGTRSARRSARRRARRPSECSPATGQAHRSTPPTRWVKTSPGLPSGPRRTHSIYSPSASARPAAGPWRERIAQSAEGRGGQASVSRAVVLGNALQRDAPRAKRAVRRPRGAARAAAHVARDHVLDHLIMHALDRGDRTAHVIAQRRLVL